MKKNNLLLHVIAVAIMFSLILSVCWNLFFSPIKFRIYSSSPTNTITNFKIYYDIGSGYGEDYSAFLPYIDNQYYEFPMQNFSPTDMYSYRFDWECENFSDITFEIEKVSFYKGFMHLQTIDAADIYQNIFASNSCTPSLNDGKIVVVAYDEDPHVFIDFQSGLTIEYHQLLQKYKIMIVALCAVLITLSLVFYWVLIKKVAPVLSRVFKNLWVRKKKLTLRTVVVLGILVSAIISFTSNIQSPYILQVAFDEEWLDAYISNVSVTYSGSYADHVLQTVHLDNQGGGILSTQNTLEPTFSTYGTLSIESKVPIVDPVSAVVSKSKSNIPLSKSLEVSIVPFYQESYTRYTSSVDIEEILEGNDFSDQEVVFLESVLLESEQVHKYHYTIDYAGNKAQNSGWVYLVYALDCIVFFGLIACLAYRLVPQKTMRQMIAWLIQYKNKLLVCIDNWKVSKNNLYFLFVYLISFFPFAFLLRLIPFYNRPLFIAELLFLYIGMLMVICLGRINGLRKGKLVIFCASAAIPLYVSIAQLSTYLNVDETRAINEQLFIATDNLRHWNMGSARTNYLVMGTIIKLIPSKFYSLIRINEYQAAKLIHWLIGIILILITIHIIYKHFIKPLNDKKCGICLSVLIWACMMNPTMLMPLKNYNYDLFSLYLGIISILLCCIAIKDQTNKYGILAMILALMATQEKLIAAPVFYVAIVLYAVIAIVTEDDFQNKSKMWVICQSARKIAWCFGAIIIFLYSTGIFLGILRDGNMPYLLYSELAKGFLGPFSLMGNITFLNANVLIINIVLTGILLLMCIVACFVLVCIAGAWTSYQHTKRKQKIIYILNIFCITLCGIIATLGVFATFKIPYIYIIPKPLWNKDAYPLTEMNNYYYHFNDPSRTSSFLKLFGSYYASLIQNNVTCILLGIYTCIFVVSRRKGSLMWSVLMLTCLLIPSVYAISGILPNSKYMNLFIMGIIVSVTVLLLRWLIQIDKRVALKRFLSISAAIVITLEVAGFGPSFAEFVPLWYMTPSYDNIVPTGKEFISIQGGIGEHIALAGNKITQIAVEEHLPASSINIFSDYKGSWQTNGYNYNVQIFPTFVERKTGSTYDPIEAYEDFSFEHTDFYVFTRFSANARISGVPYPHGIQPDAVIEMRGIPMCWIYRGDKLQGFFEENIGIITSQQPYTPIQS